MEGIRAGGKCQFMWFAKERVKIKSQNPVKMSKTPKSKEFACGEFLKACEPGIKSCELCELRVKFRNISRRTKEVCCLCGNVGSYGLGMVGLSG
jgi:hypothetical protein